jgi:uncharacterized protein (TIGR02996 family)
MIARTEGAFLCDIAAGPEEDTPRLVYADWLQEHAGAVGCARADFIRAQCHLEYLRADEPLRHRLERRAAALEAQFGRAWLGPLDHPALRWHFRRGFVAALAHTGLFHRVAPGGSDAWLRFAPDGTVLACSTTKATASEIASWLRPDHLHAARGRYSLCPAPGGLSIFLAVTSAVGPTHGAGTLVGTSLVLDVHAQVNNYRAREHYVWVDVPVCDSCGG